VKKISVVFLVLVLFVAACGDRTSDQTSDYLDNGKSSIAFDPMCDPLHNFGVWVKILSEGSAEYKTAVAISVRMTESEWSKYCAE
jgi:hypothetical protein